MKWRILVLLYPSQYKKKTLCATPKRILVGWQGFLLCKTCAMSLAHKKMVLF